MSDKLLILGALLAASLPAADKQNPFESPVAFAPRGHIDELVAAQWHRLSIPAPSLCSDAVFLRRAFLDVIGALPTAEEASAFLADPDPAKRSLLIDKLLARDEFADYLAMKWSDLLRIKAEFPINLWPNAAQAYYQWLHSALAANRPYDEFARELLTSSGSNFRAPAVNFYRAMQSKDPRGIAQSVALTFLASRFDKWTPSRQAGLAAFFSQVGYKETGEWKEEIVFFDLAKKPAAAVFPDGVPARIPPGQDPRQVFADWLVSPRNSAFSAAIVNRIWSWLLGRGIVQEPDDFRPDNPPENPELLAYLQQELVSAHFDLKHIYRLILNSSTYQLSSTGPSAAHFAAYPLRRLDAEVLIDALNQITGGSETYTSSIPEPYTFMPDFQRAIVLPDGSISSSFLEEFGRPPRDTGLESERNNRITGAQRLHMLNASQVQRKIQQSPKLQAMMRDIRNPRDLIRQIYLTILSRPPTEQEWQLITAHSQNGNVRGQAAVVDLVWALLNTTEFLYRH